MQLLGEDYEVAILPQLERPDEPRDLARSVSLFELQHAATSVEHATSRCTAGRRLPLFASITASVGKAPLAYRVSLSTNEGEGKSRAVLGESWSSFGGK